LLDDSFRPFAVLFDQNNAKDATPVQIAALANKCSLFLQFLPDCFPEEGDAQRDLFSLVARASGKISDRESFPEQTVLRIIVQPALYRLLISECMELVSDVDTLTVLIGVLTRVAHQSEAFRQSIIRCANIDSMCWHA
jgi:hypothetical protein